MLDEAKNNQGSKTNTKAKAKDVYDENSGSNVKNMENEYNQYGGSRVTNEYESNHGSYAEKETKAKDVYDENSGSNVKKVKGEYNNYGGSKVVSGAEAAGATPDEVQEVQSDVQKKRESITNKVKQNGSNPKAYLKK